MSNQMSNQNLPPFFEDLEVGEKYEWNGVKWIKFSETQAAEMLFADDEWTREVTLH